MSKNTSGKNEEEQKRMFAELYTDKNIHIDRIINGKMNLNILSCAPKNNFMNSKDIEKKLFNIFKEYVK